jgi:hypothetical protein
LQFNPVFKRAEIIANVDNVGRLNAGENFFHMCSEK